MGLRFRKTISLLPGLRANFTKSGTSLSVGGKGVTYNIGPKGCKTIVGPPSTGLYYQQNEGKNLITGHRGSFGVMFSGGPRSYDCSVVY